MLCFDVEEEVVVIRNGWTPKKKRKNVNESYNNFVGIFVDIYDYCCPLKQGVIKKNSMTWITDCLRNACRKKIQHLIMKISININ